MYYKLPVKERLKYMEAFRKANPNMSYHDMVNDYNTSYQKFGDGGKSNGMTGLMKSKIATEAHYGNPAALRMVSPNPKTGMTPEGIGTHYMTSFDNYAVPLLQDFGDPKLRLVDGMTPSKEDIRFNSPEEAQYFAEHYKEVAPMMRNFQENKYGGIQKFEDGGKKDLPKKDSNEFSDYQRPGPVASENPDDYFTWFRKSQLNEAADYLPMIQMPLYNSRKPQIIASPTSEEPLPVKQNNKEFPKFLNVSNNQKPVYLFPAATTYQGGKEQNSPYHTGIKEKEKTNEDLRKELDIIQSEIKKGEFNPFKFYKMQKRAGEIYKILGSEKPELVDKETKTGQNAGKLMIASGKYIFPQASPLFNTIEGGLSVYDFYKDKNAHNIASLMTEAAPYIRRNNKYNKFYQLMGDYLTGQEVGLLPEDKK